MAVYFSKKRKKEMLARKNKKKLKGDRDEAAINKVPHNEVNRTESTASTSDPLSEKSTTVRNDKSTKNKKGTKQDLIINRKLIIRIPSGLDSQQSKKFRKDIRRKIRKRTEESNSQSLNTKNFDFDDILFLNQEDVLPEQTLPCKGTSEKDNSNHGDVKSLLPPPRKKTKRSYPRINELIATEKETKSKAEERDKIRKSLSKLTSEEKSKYIALDCEMVGVGAGGKQSALARVSLTDFDGELVMDTYVQVLEKVTDFRTFVSGVRAKDIKVSKNKSAMGFQECRMKVGKILLHNVLIGHSVQNDLKALLLDHPKKDIRDTARFPDFMKVTGKNGGKLRPRKLKDLAKEKLGLDIQIEGMAHSSVEDAKATMELYKSVRNKWEKHLASKRTK